jgi:hypothetical protein
MSKPKTDWPPCRRQGQAVEVSYHKAAALQSVRLESAANQKKEPSVEKNSITATRLRR